MILTKKPNFMKKIVLIFSLTLFVGCPFIYSQVGINTSGSNPDPSAMMDVSSTTKGLLIPRMTKAERNGILNPAIGLIVFQTDNTPGLYFNSGTPTVPSWVLAGGNSGLWQTSGSNVYYYEGNVGIMEMNPIGRLHVSAPGDWNGIVFTGTGTNDLAVNNAGFTGDGATNYAIRIQNSGPDPNLIEISMNGGSSWSAPIPITPNIAMGNGVFATFNNDGGHTYNDRWDWTVNKSYPDMLVIKNGNTGFGTSTPDNSALVDMTSSEKGFLCPRMTGTERDAINDPAKGLLIYCTDDNQFYMNRGTAGAPEWSALKGQWETNGSNLYYSGGNVGIGTDNPTYKLQVENGDAQINLLTIGKGGGSQSTNSAFGTEALFLNSTGNYNTACGFAVLGANTTGSYNTATGYSTLGVNITGSNNTAIGSSALSINATGYSNTAIGVKALYLSSALSNLVAVGDSALYNNGTGATGDQGKFNTALGSKTLYSNSTGLKNTSVGYQALNSNTTGSENTAAGFEALKLNVSGLYNTAIGVQALKYNNGYGNTAVGWDALILNSSGQYNVALGIAPLQNNTGGNNNIGIGRDALINNTYASNNISIGDYALFTQSYNSSNTAYVTNNNAIGNRALYTNNPTSTVNGINNNAMGYYSLNLNTTGYGNSAFGHGTLSINSTGYYNTAVGYTALNDLTTGYNNTAIGYNTGPSSTYPAVYNTTSIGNGAAVTASNQVRIGNSSVTSIGGYQPWTDLSDGRFKEDVKENVPGLDFIAELRPVTYRINLKKVDEYTGATMDNMELSETRTGFIAQEVEEAAALIGFDFNGVDRPKNDMDMYGLRYAEFVVPLVKAVQEQQAIIESQQSKIESQQNQIGNQQKQIDELFLKVSKFEDK
jgi:hypothetical protein